MTLDELVRRFDYRKINKSPAVFDMGKLRWMNGEYIKRMDDEAYYALALPIIEKTVTKVEDKKALADLAKTRIETFNDIPELLGFFEEVPEYDISMYAHKKMKTTPELSLDVLKKVLPVLASFEDYSNDALYALLTAVSGKAMTPGGATQLLMLLGRDESVTRIRAAIEKLERECV